jgi:hypothetical protein
VARAEKLAAQQLPWIPDVEPGTALVLGKDLTGAVASSAYLFAPGPTAWAELAEQCAGGGAHDQRPGPGHHRRAPTFSTIRRNLEYLRGEPGHRPSQRA